MALFWKHGAVALVSGYVFTLTPEAFAQRQYLFPSPDDLLTEVSLEE